MQKNDELILNIESFSNLGYGIAKFNGLVIFVENTCPKDIVKVKLYKINKNYAYAKVIEIITPSPYRVQPFCPLQKVCGACQMQFIDYDFQLNLKQEIVNNTIKKIGGIDIEIPSPVPSPDIKEYRHKIQYPISITKNSKRMVAGYYKPASHEIINIKYCPIQPKICDEIIDFIRNEAEKYRIMGFDENKHNGDLRHVVIRNSVKTGKNLVVLVVNATKTFERLNNFAKAIYENFNEVSGVCINFNSKKTNIILGRKTECVIGDDYILETIMNKQFKIGASTFFQVNPKSAENIFRYVKTYIKNTFKKPLLLDAYAGISAFGICLSDTCKNVVCVEENSESCELAKDSLKINDISNVEINNLDAEKYFAQEKRMFDVVILDPPRKGCSQNTLDNVLKVCKGKIIYVSCNPATLARDLKYLTEKCATVESIQPFDMFCHTYHIENVAIITVA